MIAKPRVLNCQTGAKPLTIAGVRSGDGRSGGTDQSSSAEAGRRIRGRTLRARPLHTSIRRNCAVGLRRSRSLGNSKCDQTAMADEMAFAFMLTVRLEFAAQLGAPDRA